MFTGIVEEIGEVLAVRRAAPTRACPTVRGPPVTSDARHGDSIAVNGVCLTVIDPTSDRRHVRRGPGARDAAQRSSLAPLAAGARVNLERAVAGRRPPRRAHRAGPRRRHGHPRRRTPGERSDELRFRLPADLARYVVEKGSIAVDGVSLTVADVDADAFAVALIPTTLARTTLGLRAPGDTVNLEVDVVAKYVERLTVGYRAERSRDEEAKAWTVGDGTDGETRRRRRLRADRAGGRRHEGAARPWSWSTTRTGRTRAT